MKSFIKNLLLFTLFAAGCYVVLIILFGTFAPSFLQKNLNYRLGATGHMLSRAREADSTKDVDILILGSSHAYRNYDTRIFREKGFKVFNLGSSAQTPVQTEILVRKYLSSLRPKLVLFDVYPAVFDSDGIESSIDLLANVDLDMGVKLDMTLRSNNIKMYNNFLYSQYRKTMKLDQKFKEPSVKPDGTYIPGGYVQLFRKFNRKRTVKPSTYQMDDYQQEAFCRILDTLKSHKIDYVLVQSPITNTLFTSRTNNPAMDSYFMKHGSYYNFNYKMSLPDSMYYDDNHLNQYGVNIYNEILFSTIQDHLRSIQSRHEQVAGR